MPRKITEVIKDLPQNGQGDGAFWTSGLYLWNKMTPEDHDETFDENNYDVVFYDGDGYVDGLWRICVYGLKYDTNGKDWTVDEDNVMWFAQVPPKDTPEKRVITITIPIDHDVKEVDRILEEFQSQLGHVCGDDEWTDRTE
tara:strand:- start:1271 stop:1693 length:423 start_codon:yes stop_codon:yes gene_type:complete